MKVDITYEKPRYSAHVKKLSISTQAKNRDTLMKNINEAIELHYQEEAEYKKNKALNMKFYLNIMTQNAPHLQRA